MPDPARPRLLVVIPGNPGDAVFYGDFTRALAALGHEVTVASHLALTSAPASLLPYAHHQAEAVIAYLAGTGRAPDDVDIVLIGHSVGAYLAHLIVARRLLPVARVFLLFPFLARPARTRRLILTLMTSPWRLAGFLRLWRVLPARLQRGLIAAAGAGAHGGWVQEALASARAASWVAMAKVEAKEIAGRADARYLLDEPLFRDPARAVTLWCRGDRWAPQARGLPGAEELAGVHHGFVVDPAQCRIVAGVIDRHLR